MNRIQRILLVEDSPNDVELTLEALAEYRLANEVFVLRDGEEALQFLLREGRFEGFPPGNPAVILLDLKLPRVDGHEVLRRIRSEPDLSAIPVVVLTSSREEKDRAASYLEGSNAYVVKPVEFHAFIDAVKSLGVFWAIVNEPPPGSVRKEL